MLSLSLRHWWSRLRCIPRPADAVLPALLLPGLLLPGLLLTCALLGGIPLPADARTATVRVDRVRSDVATLQGVRVDLDWPGDAQAGIVRLRIASAQAPALAAAFTQVDWTCTLHADAQGAWHCDGPLQLGNARAVSNLSLVLGKDTDAVLARGASRITLQRRGDTPALTSITLAKIPLAWAQGLLSQAWADARISAGTVSGALAIRAADDGPLRIAGTLDFGDAALATQDSTTATEHLSARVALDYRQFPAARLVSLQADLRGGQLLSGSTYVALPASPVVLSLDAMQRAGEGWDIATLHWRDGDALRVDGGLQLTPDLDVQHLQLDLHSADLSPVVSRYLSGNLAATGLGELGLDGALDARVQVSDGQLSQVDATLHRIDVRDPQARYRFDGLQGEIRFSDGAQADSQLQWDAGALHGVAFGPTRLPLRSRDSAIALQSPASIPMLGGALRLDSLQLQPATATHGLQMQFGLTVQAMDLAQLSKVMDWPAFRGSLDGSIPHATYADDTLVFDGGLSLHVFDGTVAVTALAMERPFGVAPTLSADLAIDDVDLLAVTEVFGFGSITGRLDGSIDGLRLVDWGATAFDARLQTQRRPGVRQRISQRAVQNISSVGDASFVSSLQGQLIGLFDDFGYARIGFGCRLRNAVCSMTGIDASARAATSAQGFLMVEGSGVPRLDVVGFNRQVDWPTLVERLTAVANGDVEAVVE